RSRSRRAAIVRRPAARAVNTNVGHADFARPPDLPPETVVRSVRRPRRLRLLPARRPPARAPAGQSAPGEIGGSSESRAGSSTMKRKAFEQLVQDALVTIPPHFRQAMRNLAIVVEDEPSPDLLEQMEIRSEERRVGKECGCRRWTQGVK